MSLWGIDISNHQPTADLAKAKAAGCSFVFAKATEGATYADPYFDGFRAKAASLGLPLGAYHFARPQPGRTGAQEAGAFLHVVGQVKAGELPCVLDLEDTKLPAQSTTAWALDWLRTVHRATGIRPILYTYSAFAQAHLFPSAELATYPLWLANYRTSAPPAPAPWKSWHIWQHTSSARVPGIAGNCDRNVTNLTPAQLAALGKPAVAAAPPEDDMPAPKDLWDYKIVGPDGKFVASAAAYLTYGNAKAGQAARDAGAALAVVKALVAKPAGLTPDEIEAAAKAGAKAALEEEIDSATVTLNTTQNGA